MSDNASPTFDLTEREIEILELLNEGYQNKEIANHTGLTLYTVKWYLKQIYSKLYVSNRTQAATKARELGLLTPDVKIATRTMAAIRTNLPKIMTPFFGRIDESDQIKQLLLDHDIRLVTLHGIGGIGKTRLALEVAQGCLGDFGDGVYFIPMESNDQNPLIALMNTLSLNLTGSPIAQQLATALYSKHMLIVFDNFEHLLSYAKDINTLLEHTQALQVLVTSREILGLQGEYVVALGGLGCAEDSAAYQLYIQRAALGMIDFQPTETDKQYIQKVCQLVDGMPLAIEMAAGWTKVMSPEETYKRLTRNIDLLASDEQDRPERHQSIRATFDYSLQLLPEALQSAFIKLGVFHSEGFSLAGAETVAGLSLLDMKQLLQADLLQRNDSGRFTFHPLIRQYITETLKDDPLLHADALEAHGRYYLEFSHQLIHKLHHDFKLSIINELRVETGNWVQAWHYALQQGYYDWLLDMVEIGYISEMASHWQASQKLFNDTLTAIPADQLILRGRLLALAAIFEARLYHLQDVEKSARESWALLKDTPYIWDGRAAMLYFAFLKTIMDTDDGAFAVLDEIDATEIPAQYQPNTYVDILNRIGRPLTLLYAGKFEEALPLLEKANIPVWSEAVIHLPECYLLLGMEDEAHEILVNLFTAALDNGNHRLAQMTTLYLAIVENDNDDIPHVLRNYLVELTRMKFKYELIARNAFYHGATLMLRGLIPLAKYSWYGCLHLLHELNESAQMYQYMLQIGQNLMWTIPDDGVLLLTTLTHDDQCPDSIQQAAYKVLAPLSVLSDTYSPTDTLTVFDTLLE